MTEDRLAALPDELLTAILSKLTPNSRVRMARTNEWWASRLMQYAATPVAWESWLGILKTCMSEMSKPRDPRKLDEYVLVQTQLVAHLDRLGLDFIIFPDGHATGPPIEVRAALTPPYFGKSPEPPVHMSDEQYQRYLVNSVRTEAMHTCHHRVAIGFRNHVIMLLRAVCLRSSPLDALKRVQDLVSVLKDPERPATNALGHLAVNLQQGDPFLSSAITTSSRRMSEWTPQLAVQLFEMLDYPTITTNSRSGTSYLQVPKMSSCHPLGSPGHDYAKCWALKLFLRPFAFTNLTSVLADASLSLDARAAFTMISLAPGGYNLELFPIDPVEWDEEGEEEEEEPEDLEQHEADQRLAAVGDFARRFADVMQGTAPEDARMVTALARLLAFEDERRFEKQMHKAESSQMDYGFYMGGHNGGPDFPRRENAYPSMIGFLHEWSVATHFPTAWGAEARAVVIAEIASSSAGRKKVLARLAISWMVALAEPFSSHPNHAAITSLAEAVLGVE